MLRIKQNLSLLSAALLLSACQAGNYDGGIVRRAPSAGSSPDAGIDPEAAYGMSALANKNFIQIYEGMWAATRLEAWTGLSRENGTFNGIRTFYNNNRGSFPTSSNVEQFTASHMLAITNLAWEFCDRLLDVQAAREGFFAGTIFANITSNTIHRPQDLLGSDSNRRILVERILSEFWGTEVVETSFRVNAEAELVQLAELLVSGNPTIANNAAGTRNIAKGICTAALSSGPMTLL